MKDVCGLDMSNLKCNGSYWAEVTLSDISVTIGGSESGVYGANERLVRNAMK